MVAPAYFEDTYIDHELSANLDSTFAFEGPEKLLEVWFWPDEKSIPSGINQEGLRLIPINEWIKILDLVNCKILSMKSSEFVDAYLLSESSLFVFSHKLILKTCGTTTTLACLNELFKIVNSYLNVHPNEKLLSKKIFKIFYSRRSFMFPDKQIHVHRDWKHEVQLLNEYFNNGKSYIVGDFTSDDHWYLYMGGANSKKASLCGSKKGQDHTFEILMTELNPTKAKKFVTSRKPGIESMVEHEDSEDSDLGHDNGMKTMELTKLDSIFKTEMVGQLPSPSLSDNLEFDESTEKGSTPSKTTYENSSKSVEFIHDAFSFSPCGFSSNSISRDSDYYYTLHITPEDGWSYASFETNYPFDSTSNISIIEVLLKVLSIFEPGKFSVTLINEIEKNEDVDASHHDDESLVDEDDVYSICSSINSKLSKSFINENDNLNRLALCDGILSKLGYKKHEKIVYDLKNEYNLLYLNFEKINKPKH